MLRVLEDRHRKLPFIAHPREEGKQLGRRALVAIWRNRTRDAWDSFPLLEDPSAAKEERKLLCQVRSDTAQIQSEGWDYSSNFSVAKSALKIDWAVSVKWEWGWFSWRKSRLSENWVMLSCLSHVVTSGEWGAIVLPFWRMWERNKPKFQQDEVKTEPMWEIAVSNHHKATLWWWLNKVLQ